MHWPRPYLSQSGSGAGPGRGQVHPAPVAQPFPAWLGLGWQCLRSAGRANRAVPSAVTRTVKLEVNQSPGR